ncbi:MAG: hypothetical protein ABH851_06705 [Methanobacteriota archaeon]
MKTSSDYHNLLTRILSNNLFKVFIFAISIKIIVFILALDWYGKDEFYYISRGLLLAQGLTPYADFQYSYPPGLLVITAIPHLIIQNAYLLMRLITATTDALNACLIYLLASRLYSKRAAFISSILYILSLGSLRASANTMSEPYIVFFILLGFYLMDKKRIFLSSIMFALCMWIKMWTFLFWMPPLLYRIYKKDVGWKILAYILFVCVILFSPLLFVYDDFMLDQRYYYSFHEVTVEGGLMLKFLSIVTYSMVYQTAILLILGVYYIIREKVKFSVNYLHMWFLTTLAFIGSRYFFPDHHILLTLPPVCILSSVAIAYYLKPIKRDIYAAMIVGVISLIWMTPFVNLSNPLGFLAYQRTSIDSTVDYLKTNIQEDELILQDFPFYSYLSGLDDVTKTGWHYSYELFTVDDISEIIESSKPAFIVVSCEYCYPEGTVDFFNGNYCKIDLGFQGYPIIYKTGL